MAAAVESPLGAQTVLGSFADACRLRNSHVESFPTADTVAEKRRSGITELSPRGRIANVSASTSR